jgi:hypothetical protein
MKRVVLIAAAALVLVLSLEAIREARAIGAAALNASVLSKVSSLARETMYPDTDYFLGKYPRPYESEARRSLDAAYGAARVRAGATSGLFFRGSAREAREMFLAAEREKILAAEPRGNWISYMAETARARSDFDAAKGRFDLDRAALIPQLREDEAATLVALRTEPMTTEVARRNAELKRAIARKEAEDRAAKREKEGVNAQAAENTRLAEVLKEGKLRGPDRAVAPSDFLWVWKDGGFPEQSARARGKPIGLTGRRLVFVYGNNTPWKMYNVHVSAGSQVDDAREELLPDTGAQITIPTNDLEFSPPKTAPTFTGTFIPPTPTR